MRIRIDIACGLAVARVMAERDSMPQQVELAVPNVHYLLHVDDRASRDSLDVFFVLDPTSHHLRIHAYITFDRVPILEMVSGGYLIRMNSTLVLIF